jgi:signal transduction histidine kinase
MTNGGGQQVLTAELSERHWPTHFARRTLVFYVLLSIVYIPLSGFLVARLATSTDALMRLEVLKGWGFIALSATALYFWTRRMVTFVETTRSQYEAALGSLERATHSRDALLASVAHDLRSPLNSILLQAEALLRKAREPEPMRLRQVIGGQVRRMNQMIQDVLDVSKLDAGQLHAAAERLATRELIQEVEQLMSATAQQASLTLTTEVANDLPDVIADRAHVMRIFENLIGNAFKFTRSGGRVTLRAEARDGEMVFSVVDTGQGISPEQLPHIFERYWQGSRGDRRGVGLGLPIVKGLAEANRGRVWAQSEPGKGTTFFFALPLQQA